MAGKAHPWACRAHSKGEAPVLASRRMGPSLVFERLWAESGCRVVIEGLLAERKFEFPVERGVPPVPWTV